MITCVLKTGSWNVKSSLQRMLKGQKVNPEAQDESAVINSEKINKVVFTLSLLRPA